MTAKTQDQIVFALRRSIRRFRRREAGATAIEFAIVAPVLLVILVGVVSYGIYFGAANSVQQLAADAARASIAGLSDEERAAIARKHVATQAQSYVLLDPARASVTAAPAAANGQMFEVSVSYDASRLEVWAFDGLLPLPSKTIVRTSVIQRGGY